jgi:hypothetical protein
VEGRLDAYGVQVELRAADGGAALDLSGEPASAPYVRTDRDGVRIESAMGPAGDHVFRYGADCLFHLSADGATLLYAAPPGRTGWQRGLLGAVLGQVSALAGNVVFDASAMASSEGAVVLIGDDRSVSALGEALARRDHAGLSRGAVALRCGDDGIDVHAGPGVARGRPAPLRAIVVLERVRGSSSLMFPLHESIPALMDAWVVPHGRLDRAEQRARGFEQIACTTPAYCLLVGEDTQPARLAETVTSRPVPPSRPPTSSSRSRKSA